MGDLLPFPRPCLCPPGGPHVCVGSAVTAVGGARMFCCGCGKDRTVPSSAADPGPCSCGSTARSSVQPVAVDGVSLQVTAAPGFFFTDGDDAA